MSEPTKAQSAFAGLQSAQVFEKGVFLETGVYSLQIDKVILKDTRKSGSALIAEAIILESNNPKYPVGSKASWFQSLRDKDVAFGAIKQFIYSVLGKELPRDKEEITTKIDPNIEALIVRAVEENCLRGAKVRVQVTNKKTQKGLDFSAHLFYPWGTGNPAA